jgi:hypothetical protein
MKLKFLYLPVIVFFFLGCSDERVFTAEEIKKKDDGLSPKGTYFWDEFGSLRGYYDLGDEESEMLGFWTGFEKKGSCSYYFYPNRLLVMTFGVHKFRGEENAYLTDVFGVWQVKNNILTAKIYGCLKYYRPTDSQPKRYEYIGMSPYEINIINTKYIDPMGYSRKPFRNFIFPKEIRKQIIIPERPGKVHMLRSLYTINVITNSGNPEKDYWYFKYVPDMLENGFSGYDIATNPELACRYFGKIFP